MVDVYLTTHRSSQHHEVESAIRRHFGGDLWPEGVDQFLHRPNNQILYSVEEDQVEPLLTFLRQLESRGQISEVFVDEEEDDPPPEQGLDRLRALTLALRAMRLADTQNSFQSQGVVEAVIATLTEAKQQLERGGRLDERA